MSKRSETPRNTTVPVIPRILLSDDDAAFAGAVCEGLCRFGFDVTVADDGGAAIEIWDREKSVAEDPPFHLCLVDFHMPRANGLDVIRHVRAVDASVPTPCVLMSAAMNEAIRREAESVKIYQILDKPVRLGTLGEVVKRAMVDVHGWPKV